MGRGGEQSNPMKRGVSQSVGIPKNRPIKDSGEEKKTTHPRWIKLKFQGVEHVMNPDLPQNEKPIKKCQ